MPRGRGTGRPTSFAQTNLVPNVLKTQTSFRKIHALEESTPGSLIHNSAFVESFQVFMDDRVSDPFRSDFGPNHPTPTRPRRIRYVAVLVSQGLRGMVDRGAQTQPKEMCIEILRDTGEQQLGYDIFHLNRKPLAIHLCLEANTFDIIEGKGDDERTWRVKLAEFDAPHANVSRNLLHHLKTACQVSAVRLAVTKLTSPVRSSRHIVIRQRCPSSRASALHHSSIPE